MSCGQCSGKENKLALNRQFLCPKNQIFLHPLPDTEMISEMTLLVIRTRFLKKLYLHVLDKRVGKQCSGKMVGLSTSASELLSTGSTSCNCFVCASAFQCVKQLHNTKCSSCCTVQANFPLPCTSSPTLLSIVCM